MPTQQMQNQISQSLHQQQQVAPALLRSLRLLTVPLADLDHEIAAELERNPVLEQERPFLEELSGDPLGSVSAAGNHPEEETGAEAENDVSALAELSEDWGDAFGAHSNDTSAEPQPVECWGAAPAPQHTLTGLLFEQLDDLASTRSPALPERLRAAAELVIGALDEQGYLKTPPADLAMIGDFTLPEIASAIQLVQTMDPAGVAAADLSESLLLQLQRNGNQDAILQRLVAEFLPEIERNHLPAVAKKLGITLEELQNKLNVLRQLRPYPAFGLDTGNTEFVVPEMRLVYRNGKLEIDDPHDRVPHLGIVPRYLKMLEDPATSAETREYLKERIAAAEELIRALALRGTTLHRITEQIAAIQEPFFRNGVKALVPLTMAEIAQKLELHETTVSRAVADKYLDTPQGLLPYRFFFSNGFCGADGSGISSRGVTERIHAMIDAEDKRRPLSDQAIADQLAQDGLQVARRTVAKYREALRIPGASQRREHH